jgi:hypothetical protein
VNRLAAKVRSLERRVDGLTGPTRAEYEAAVARSTPTGEEVAARLDWVRARVAARLNGEAAASVGPPPERLDTRTPEQVAADEATIARYHRIHPVNDEGVVDELHRRLDEVRERVMKRIDPSVIAAWETER